MRRWCFPVVVAIGALGCEAPPPPAPYEQTTEIAEFMEWLLEPAADAIWDSAGQVITEAGVEDLAPATEEGWDAVRNQAALVSELGNLLMMPHFAQDRPDWVEISRGMVRAGARVQRAAEAQDAQALFKEGGLLYQVCVSCHQIYWREGRFAATQAEGAP